MNSLKAIVLLLTLSVAVPAVAQDPTCPTGSIIKELETRETRVERKRARGAGAKLAPSDGTVATHSANDSTRPINRPAPPLENCDDPTCADVAARMDEFMASTYGNSSYSSISYDRPPSLAAGDFNNPERVVLDEMRPRNKNVRRLDAGEEGGMHWVMSDPDDSTLAVRVLRPDKVDPELIPFFASFEVGVSQYLIKRGLPMVSIRATPAQIRKGITVADRVAVETTLSKINLKKLPQAQQDVLGAKMRRIQEEINKLDRPFKEYALQRGGFARRQETKSWWRKSESREIGLDLHGGNVAFEEVTDEAVAKLGPRDAEWVVELSLPPNKKPKKYRIRILDI